MSCDCSGCQRLATQRARKIVRYCIPTAPGTYAQVKQHSGYHRLDPDGKSWFVSPDGTELWCGSDLEKYCTDKNIYGGWTWITEAEAKARLLPKSELKPEPEYYIPRGGWSADYERASRAYVLVTGDKAVAINKDGTKGVQADGLGASWYRDHARDGVWERITESQAKSMLAPKPVDPPQLTGEQLAREALAAFRADPQFTFPGKVLFVALTGSRGINCALPLSDFDFHVIYQVPTTKLLGLKPEPHQGPREPQIRRTFTINGQQASADVTAWEIGHFCNLLAKGNPNAVELLFAQHSCLGGGVDGIVNMADLVNIRMRFLTPACLRAYDGYITSELSRLTSDLRKYRGRPIPALAERLYHAVRLQNSLDSILDGNGPVAWYADGTHLHDHQLMYLRNVTGTWHNFEDYLAVLNQTQDQHKLACAEYSHDPKYTDDQARAWLDRFLTDLRTRDLTVPPLPSTSRYFTTPWLPDIAYMILPKDGGFVTCVGYDGSKEVSVLIDKEYIERIQRAWDSDKPVEISREAAEALRQTRSR